MSDVSDGAKLRPQGGQFSLFCLFCLFSLSGSLQSSELKDGSAPLVKQTEQTE